MSDPNENLAMLDRIEPNLVPINTAAGYASTAVSMKRIADAVVEAHAQMMQATRDRDDHHEAAGHDDSLGRIAAALEKIERVINPTHVLSVSAEAADALRQQIEAGRQSEPRRPVLQPGDADVDYPAILLKAANLGMVSPLRARMAADLATATDNTRWLDQQQYLFRDGMPFEEVAAQMAAMRSRMAPDVREKFDALLYSERVKAWDADVPAHRHPEFDEVPGVLSGVMTPTEAKDHDGTGTQTDIDWAAGVAEGETEGPFSGPGDAEWDATYPRHMSAVELSALSWLVAGTMRDPARGTFEEREIGHLIALLERCGISRANLEQMDTPARAHLPVPAENWFHSADPRVLTLEDFLALRCVHQVATIGTLYGLVGPDDVRTTHAAVSKGAPAACAHVHGLLISLRRFFDPAGVPETAEQATDTTAGEQHPATILDDTVLTNDEFDILRAFISAVHDLPGIGPQVYAHMMGAGHDDPRADVEAFLGRW